MAPDFDAARVSYDQLERQSVRKWLPIHLFDDNSYVDVFAGPVNASIGKQEGRERAGLALGVESTGIESREVQPPIVALVGQEGKVTFALCDIHGRSLLALEILDGREG